MHERFPKNEQFQTSVNNVNPIMSAKVHPIIIGIQCSLLKNVQNIKYPNVNNSKCLAFYSSFLSTIHLMIFLFILLKEVPNLNLLFSKQKKITIYQHVHPYMFSPLHLHIASPFSILYPLNTQIGQTKRTG